MTIGDDDDDGVDVPIEAAYCFLPAHTVLKFIQIYQFRNWLVSLVNWTDGRIDWYMAQCDGQTRWLPIRRWSMASFDSSNSSRTFSYTRERNNQYVYFTRGGVVLKIVETVPQ